MTKTPLSRREFLRLGGSLAGAAAMGAVQPAFRRDSKRARVAVVGTGNRGTGLWGRRLVEEYWDAVEIVGLCDTNPGRLEYARSYIGLDCPTFRDFGEMIEKTGAERAVVSTVDSNHHQFIIAALEGGCDVITEGPMTTDETKCQAILNADRRADNEIVVAHGHRYSPHCQRIKEVLAEGRIGNLTSVDLHCYFEINRGASFFRGWQGRPRLSGTLFVHEASHHFDLLNWWIDSDPATVYAQGALDHWGRKNSFRSAKCRGCPHQQRCDYYWDVTQEEHLVNLYTNHEHYDGYVRDGCVWSEESDTFDKLAVQLRYANGVQARYSLTTYAPYGGYRVAFTGTEGRLEAWVEECQSKPRQNYAEIRVTDNYGDTKLARVPLRASRHSGDETRMLDRIFRNRSAPDPLRQAAGVRDGALSALVGIAARMSVDWGEPVSIADLTTIEPRERRV